LSGAGLVQHSSAPGTPHATPEQNMDDFFKGQSCMSNIGSGRKYCAFAAKLGTQQHLRTQIYWRALFFSWLKGSWAGETIEVVKK